MNRNIKSNIIVYSLLVIGMFSLGGLIVSLIEHFVNTTPIEFTEVKILAPLPLQSELGQAAHNGILLALHDAGNRAGQHTVFLLTQDMSRVSDPGYLDNAENINAITRLISDQQISIILGPFTTLLGNKLTPFFNVAGLSQIGYSITGSEFTNPLFHGADVEYVDLYPGGRQTFFSLTFNTNDIVEATVNYAIEEYGCTNPIAIHDNTSLSKPLTTLWQQTFSQKQAISSSTITLYDISKEEDFNSISSDIADRDPDCIFLSSYPHTQYRSFITEFAKTGFSGLIIGPYLTAGLTQDLVLLAKSAQIVSLDAWGGPESFTDHYREFYKEKPPSPVAFTAYQATELALHAITNAGTDREAIREYLSNNSSDYKPRFGGEYTFNTYGKLIRVSAILYTLNSETGVFEKEKKVYFETD